MGVANGDGAYCDPSRIMTVSPLRRTTWFSSTAGHVLA